MGEKGSLRQGGTFYDIFLQSVSYQPTLVKFRGSPFKKNTLVVGTWLWVVLWGNQVDAREQSRHLCQAGDKNNTQLFLLNIIIHEIELFLQRTKIIINYICFSIIILALQICQSESTAIPVLSQHFWLKQSHKLFKRELWAWVSLSAMALETTNFLSSE